LRFIASAPSGSLFALTAAAVAIALITWKYDWFFPEVIASHLRATIIAAAACFRTIERYETRHANPQRSVPILLGTLVARSVALAICGAVGDRRCDA
jgi:hypothetical protein